MDTLLSPIMDDLRACATAALEGTLGGSIVCATTLMPGTIAPADWCSCKGRSSCGMLWVRLDRLFPSSARFPAPDSAGTCTTVLAANLEVGVYRCQPTSGPGGTPPSVAEQTQAALVQADDALALLRGISCCDAITKRSYVLGSYTPKDGGGCGGGHWQVTVQLTRR